MAEAKYWSHAPQAAWEHRGLQSLPFARRPMHSCRSVLHSSNMSVHALDGYCKSMLSLIAE